MSDSHTHFDPHSFTAAAAGLAVTGAAVLMAGFQDAAAGSRRRAANARAIGDWEAVVMDQAALIDRLVAAVQDARLQAARSAAIATAERSRADIEARAGATARAQLERALSARARS